MNTNQTLSESSPPMGSHKILGYPNTHTYSSVNTLQSSRGANSNGKTPGGENAEMRSSETVSAPSFQVCSNSTTEDTKL